MPKKQAATGVIPHWHCLFAPWVSGPVGPDQSAVSSHCVNASFRACRAMGLARKSFMPAAQTTLPVFFKGMGGRCWRVSPLVNPLENRGHQFARYTDDCNVYLRSQKTGERVLSFLHKQHEKLHLRANEKKTDVGSVFGRWTLLTVAQHQNQRLQPRPRLLLATPTAQWRCMVSCALGPGTPKQGCLPGDRRFTSSRLLFRRLYGPADWLFPRP